MAEEATITDNTGSEAPAETQSTEPQVTEPTSTETPAAQEQASAEAPKTTEAPATEAPDEGLLSKAGDIEAPAEYTDFDLSEQWGETQADLKAIAKDMKLDQATAETGAKFAAAAMEKLVAEHQESTNKWIADNKAEWEQDSNHAEKTLLAEKALAKSQHRDHFIERGYQHDAKLLGMMADLGRLLSEGKALSGGDAATGDAANPYVNSPELVQ